MPGTSDFTYYQSRSYFWPLPPPTGTKPYKAGFIMTKALPGMKKSWKWHIREQKLPSAAALNASREESSRETQYGINIPAGVFCKNKAQNQNQTQCARLLNLSYTWSHCKQHLPILIIKKVLTLWHPSCENSTLSSQRRAQSHMECFNQTFQAYV